MKIKTINQPIFKTYLVFNATLALYSVTFGNIKKLPILFGDELYPTILFTFISIALVIFLTGGILLWLAENKSMKWAAWGFIGFCAWRIIDLIFGAYQTNIEYSNTYLAKTTFFILFWAWFLFSTSKMLRGR